MRKLALWGAGLFSMLLIAGPATAAPTVMPQLNRTLAARGPAAASCPDNATRKGRGVALTRYSAPMSGFVTVRLAGRKGDWDLGLADAASKRRLGTSRGFGSREVAQSWVAAGQRLSIAACHNRGASRRARLTVALVDVAPPTSPGTPSLVRVAGTPQQLAGLEQLGYEVTENRGAGWADVVASDSGQVDKLKQLGIKFQTRIADLTSVALRSRRADARYRASVAGASPLPSGRTTYRTYDDIQAELKQLVADHPNRVRPVTIGRSFQGRELSGVEIANGVKAKGDGRPTYFVMATHHAREWPAAEAAMEYATLLAGSKGDRRIGNLLARERTLIIPLVNPDGFVATQNAEGYDPYDNTDPNRDDGSNLLHTGEAVAPPGGIFSYRRKNCDGDVPSGDFPCELQAGVDPNRNYGEYWGGPGSSPDPTTQVFHGPDPFSEPETQAVRNWTRTHQVTGLITLHNVAALVLRPPGAHGQGLAPDEKRMKEIGDAMAADAGYTSQYGWQLYDTTGTTEDYTYAAQGGYGYTIEMGPPNGTFHMPYQKGVVDEWTGNGGHGATPGKGLRDALLLAGEAAANRADHSVIAGKAPPGATLRVRREFTTDTSEYCRKGLDPVVISAAIGGPYCAPGQEGGPDKVPDFFESTLPVSRSGRYMWQTNPSTRPFVGGGAANFALDGQPTESQTLGEGQPGDTFVGDSKYYPFTIKGDEGLTRLSLTFPNAAEDYDLYAFRCDGVCDNDATRPSGDPDDTQIGSSAGASGAQEKIELAQGTPAGSNYYARVDNFLGPTSTYKLTLDRFQGHWEYTTGHREAYTMTCERGGKVLGTRQVTVDRGKAVVASFDKRCRPTRR
jgi:hypothetical protein